MVTDSKAKVDGNAIGFMTAQFFGQHLQSGNFTYGSMIAILDSNRQPVLVSNYTGIHFEKGSQDHELEAYLTSTCDMFGDQSNSPISWYATLGILLKEHRFVVVATEDPLHDSDEYTDDEYWPWWWNQAMTSKQLETNLVKGKERTSKMIVTKGLFVDDDFMDTAYGSGVQDNEYAGHWLFTISGKIRDSPSYG